MAEKSSKPELKKYTFKAISPEGELIVIEVDTADFYKPQKPPPGIGVRIAASLAKASILVQSDYGMAVRAGKRAWQEGGKELALRHFDKALTVVPDAKEALRYKGNLLQELGMDAEAQKYFSQLSKIKSKEEDKDNKKNVIVILVFVCIVIGLMVQKWLIPWIKSIDDKDFRMLVSIYFVLLGVWLTGGAGIIVYVTAVHRFNDIYTTVKNEFEGYFIWGAVGFIGIVLIVLAGIAIIAILKAIIGLIVMLIKAVLALAVVIGVIAAIAAGSEKK